jgi:hypothetical protein
MVTGGPCGWFLQKDQGEALLCSCDSQIAAGPPLCSEMVVMLVQNGTGSLLTGLRLLCAHWELLVQPEGNTSSEWQEAAAPWSFSGFSPSSTVPSSTSDVCHG